MSATYSNSNVVRPSADEIWSRGGGSFRRLVWKEFSEVAGICGVFVLGILIAAVWARWEWVHRREMFSLPMALVQVSGLVFPVLVGARAFAREMENGTWELLRSAGASAWDVWLSKLLVAFLSSSGISLLSEIAISLSLSRGVPFSLEVFFNLLGWLVGLSAFLRVLVLTVSMQCSLWLRRSWAAMVASAASALPLVYLTNFLAAEWRQHLSVLPHSEAVGLHPLGDIVLSVAVVTVAVFLWTIQLWRLRRELLDHSAINASRRWRQVFRRMAWKEQLAVRDFWLAVIGILIFLDLLASFVFRDPTTRGSVIVSLSVMMPLLHSLGCGAIAFALEREDGTQDWLRRISAPASSVFAAKLLVSQASIVSLTSLVLMGTQLVVAPGDRLRLDGCAMVMLAATLNGILGLCASLLTWRVLPAMFLAFVSVAAVDVSLLLLGYGVFDKGNPLLRAPLAILPWWLLVGAVLLAIEWRLADRWLNERRWWPRHWRSDSPSESPSRPQGFWFDWSSSPEQKAFGRLLWREWMEAKGWLWVLPLVFIPALSFDMLDLAPRAGRGVFALAMTFLLIPVSTLLTIGLCVLPVLMGVWAFHHDQRQGLFRFLADRGGSPRQIWQSKHAVWLTLVLVLAGLAGAITELQSSSWQREGLAPGQLTGFALVFALQSYAAGQAMSQWTRSALIAMFLASVLSLFLWLWTLLLAQELRAPWPYQFGAAPILFFASWNSSRDWLEERWTWRAWRRIALSLVLPATALVLALEAQGYHVCRAIRSLVIPQ